MGIFSFFKKFKNGMYENEEDNNFFEDDKRENYIEDIRHDDKNSDINIKEETEEEINNEIEEKEIEIEIEGNELEETEEVNKEENKGPTQEEIDNLIINEILKVIDIYDDFDEVKSVARDAAIRIGKDNLRELPKFLNNNIHMPSEYDSKYFDEEEWNVAVENSVLMIIYSFKGNAVSILERVSQKNSKLNLKATNLLCKLASEGVKTEEIVNWITNNLITFNDDNKMIILGFMSQIKKNNQVIGIIQHFYRSFVKSGEIEYAYRTLKHLINAAERFTQGHLKFLKIIAMGKTSINLSEIMTIDDNEEKIVEIEKVSEELSINAAMTYYTLDQKDDDINSKLYYLSEYSLNKELREDLKILLEES
ncbi:hypothetical protein [Clostridium tertium]|uniref:Uncharacterized protein n=1 Tax=Clostridium tertium TaxID=1559 RepID=A0A6N3C0I7_9CLOT